MLIIGSYVVPMPGDKYYCFHCQKSLCSLSHKSILFYLEYGFERVYFLNRTVYKRVRLLDYLIVWRSFACFSKIKFCYCLLQSSHCFRISTYHQLFTFSQTWFYWFTEQLSISCALLSVLFGLSFVTVNFFRLGL